jgi:hypothetical protein
MPALTSIFAKSAQSNAVIAPIEEENETLPEPAADAPEYTDDDLAEVLAPIMERTLQNQWRDGGASIETLWEPWLRNVMRRVCAEQHNLLEPIEEPGFFQQLAVRMKCYFGNRSYAAWQWENAGRCRIEEVYLLDREQRTLLSYATRHAARRDSRERITSELKQWLPDMFDAEGTMRLQLPLPHGRNAEVCEGRQCLLIAVTLGHCLPAMRADLHYTLRRIETHYGMRLAYADRELCKNLQEFLQDCLLITTPHLF